MKGWVKLHRQIYDHWLFQEKRVFSKFEAWIDLTMLVNHSANKIMMDGQIIEVERGSFVTSIRKLCDRWGWSNTKVKKFLDVLESEGMLIQKNDTKKTFLSLVNYSKFQGCEDEETTAKRQQNDTETSQKHTNKNVEELENDKNVLEKDSRPKQVYDDDSPYMRMAIYFIAQIMKWKPDYVMRGSMQKWSDDFRKMHELDKRTKEDIKDVIDFVTADSFEQVNVMSPDKMRKRFDQLHAKTQKAKRSGAYGQQPNDQQRSQSVTGGKIGWLNKPAQVPEMQ